MSFNLDSLVRENIKRLAPYSSARSEFSGAAQIYLDANENSFGSPIKKNYHRYPDPLQTNIKGKLAEMQNIGADEVFIGNGSDEAIDLLFRIFCRPQKDNVLVCPPTYGMYEVSAAINDVAVKRANLTEDFELDFERIKQTIDENTKLVFICSPNNPTGNLMRRERVLEIARDFRGIVVVDEAYIHFSSEKSLIGEIKNHPNLVVLQTFSKAWGLAGLRVGLGLANTEIIRLFNRVKPPYNVSQAAQEIVLQALENVAQVEKNVDEIIVEREKLTAKLREFHFVKKIYPTDANFILVKTSNAERIYQFLLNEKIVVRNRSNVELCAGCLRITVGTPNENASLIESLTNLATEIMGEIKREA